MELLHEFTRLGHVLSTSVENLIYNKLLEKPKESPLNNSRTNVMLIGGTWDKFLQRGITDQASEIASKPHRNLLLNLAVRALDS